ncbi:MAG: hypothetical protein ACOY5B_17915 [Spirochaetota bacterium]
MRAVKHAVLFSLLLVVCATTAVASGKVRDVALQRNQVTVTMSKAGAFALGKKIYFYRNGKATGSAEVTQAFHTKAIARILTGSPQSGDDASAAAKAPKQQAKISRVSFAASSVQAQEFLVELQFENQEKIQRKLTLNAELAVLMKGAPTYMGLSAALLRRFDLLWENGALRVTGVELSDRSRFELAGLVASDLYQRIKPAAETRNSTVPGKIVFLKKVRDLPQLADGVEVELKAAKESERMKQGSVYKLKVYCNELFMTEFLLKPQGSDLSDQLVIAPVDLAATENNLEFRLVEVTDTGDLLLETDNNQLIAMLALENNQPDRNARVRVTLGKGYDAFANTVK